MIENKIITWAEERGIFVKGTVKGQKYKTIEEMAELIQAICKNDITLIKDSIGDVYVTLVIGAKLQGNIKLDDLKPTYTECDKKYFLTELASKLSYLVTKDTYGEKSCNLILYLLKQIAYAYYLTFNECVEYAFNEIKDRKGTMKNGTFVKEK